MRIRLRRMAMLLFGTMATLYLGLCGLVFVKQRALLFPAPREGRAPHGANRLVQVPGGTVLLWVAPPDERAAVVVHFHGNAEQIAESEWLGGLYAQAGLGFAAVEYPGYGLRAGQGSPSEASLTEAGEQALRHLTGPLGISRERLVLSGQSIGTGVAVELASRGWGARLLLLTPYTALPDLAAGLLPFLPVRLLMLDRFENIAKAPSIRIPVLVIHGTADEVVPFALGKALAGAFPSARLVEISGGHHNDLWEREAVRSAAVSFAAGRSR